MEIILDKYLKFKLPAEMIPDVVNNIPQAKSEGDDVYIRWDYNNTTTAVYHLDNKLPHRDIPNIPSPILRDYGWPRTFPTVFDHQKKTSSFLSLRSRAFCFSEAGTGKSASCIWAADYLMQMGLISRVLIICPLSIMYTAWQSDIFQTAMHRSVGVAYGDKSKRDSIINYPYDFTIINYAGVTVSQEAIGAARFDLIIVDECNAYKSASTQRWKTLAKLISPSTRLWMLTGTPASQSPCDAFGIAKMVCPHRVPKYSSAWRNQVMTQVSRFKYVPKPLANTAVFSALQPAIRFTKKECLDLPPMTFVNRDVPLSSQATAYYKKLKSQLLIEAAGEEVSAVNAAAAMSKLLQIAGGAVYTDTKNVLEFDIKPRLSVLLEVIEECSNKIIIFVPYLHTIPIITEFLNGHGFSNAVIQGSVSGGERAEIINRFQQATDPRVLVVQPQSTAHGVTLTQADTIVFWSPVTSVEIFTQCCARIDRIGQNNKMLVVLLQGSDIERKTYDYLQDKLDNHAKLVDLYRSVMSSSEV